MKTKRFITGNGIRVWLLITLSSVTFGISSAKPHQIFDGNRHKVGFVTGIGNQNFLKVEYSYEVLFFQMQYYYSVVSKGTWSLEVLVQPQYNLTEYRHLNDQREEMMGYEFGLNAGLLIRKNFANDLFGIYTFISTGPHYVSGVPDRQADKFIFSDNLFVGMNVRIIQGWYLDLRPGFRHISNAGLQEANGGVNTFVVNLGFFKTF